MRSIEISEETFRRLKNIADPHETSELVIRRLLDTTQRPHSVTPLPPDVEIVRTGLADAIERSKVFLGTE